MAEPRLINELNPNNGSRVPSDQPQIQEFEKQCNALTSYAQKLFSYLDKDDQLAKNCDGQSLTKIPPNVINALQLVELHTLNEHLSRLTLTSAKNPEQKQEELKIDGKHKNYKGKDDDKKNANDVDYSAIAKEKFPGLFTDTQIVDSFVALQDIDFRGRFKEISEQNNVDVNKGKHVNATKDIKKKK